MRLAAALLLACLAVEARASEANLSLSGRDQVRADLAVLAAWLSGSFSSAAQAAQDDEFRDIRLQVAPIWRERADGPWLYVEQAAATSLEAPYRQRVYHLVAHDDGSLESVVYALPHPERVVGAWRRPELLAHLTPDGLEERTGCSIRLRRRADGSFVGRTGERSCPSDLRGASHATSEVTVTAGQLVSWDRGFDADGQQVWGAETGGYRFVREP